MICTSWLSKINCDSCQIKINCDSCQIKIKCDHCTIVMTVQMLTVHHLLNIKEKINNNYLVFTVVLKERKESIREHMNTERDIYRERVVLIPICTVFDRLVMDLLNSVFLCFLRQNQIKVQIDFLKFQQYLRQFSFNIALVLFLYPQRLSLYDLLNTGKDFMTTLYI
jgi:hypothetical protein